MNSYIDNYSQFTRDMRTEGVLVANSIVYSYQVDCVQFLYKLVISGKSQSYTDITCLMESMKSGLEVPTIHLL